MIRIDGVDHEASPAVVELIHSLQVQGAEQTQDQIRALRARVDELSRSYAVQGLALEELTAERDRYREALERISRDNLVAREALKEPTK